MSREASNSRCNCSEKQKQKQQVKKKKKKKTRIKTNILSEPVTVGFIVKNKNKNK